jgi:hypothetical protein
VSGLPEDIFAFGLVAVLVSSLWEVAATKAVPWVVLSAVEHLEGGRLVVVPVEGDPHAEVALGLVEVDRTVFGPAEADHKVPEVEFAEERMGKAAIGRDWAQHFFDLA